MKRDYPVPMFKDLHAPKWVTNQKELEALEAQGWTEHKNNIPKQVWPRHVYRVRDGAAVTVGNYDKEGVIDPDRAEAELKKLTADGSHSLTPIRIQASTPRPENTGEGITRLDTLEDEVGVIKQDIASVRDTLDQIMQHIREQNQPRKPGRPKKETVEA